MFQILIFKFTFISFATFRSRLPQANQPHFGFDQEQEPEHQDGVAGGIPVWAGWVPPSFGQNAKPRHLPKNQTFHQKKVWSWK